MKQDILIELYKKHNNWIVILKRLGANNAIAEDLVQDMYVKMHLVNKKTLIESLDVYAYFVLRNLYFDYFKKLKVKRKNEIYIEDIKEYEKNDYLFEVQDDNTFCMKSEIQASKEIDELELAKSTLQWYDRKVLNLHYSGVTMRSLSRETGISLSSIFNTIKNARNTLKEQMNEK